MDRRIRNCFFCGSDPLSLISSVSQWNRNVLRNWSRSCAAALCSILELDQTFESVFTNASFCSKCQETVCSADFTVNLISRLQAEVSVIRNGIEVLLQENYERIMEEQLRMGNKNAVIGGDKESIQNIIRTIDMKAEPEESYGTYDTETTELILPDVSPPSSQRLLNLKNRQKHCQPRKKLSISRSSPYTKSKYKFNEQDSFPRIANSNVSASVPNSRTSEENPTPVTHSRFGRKLKPLVVPDEVKDEEGPPTDEDDYSPIHDSDAEEENPESYDSDSSNDNEMDVESDSPTKIKRPSQVFPEVKLTCNYPECSGQNLIFRQVRSVKLHLKVEHSDTNLRLLYHCSECSQRFDRAKRLQGHIFRLHTAEGLSRPKPPRKKYRPRISKFEKQASQSNSCNKNREEESVTLKLTCNKDSCQGKGLTFETIRGVRDHLIEKHGGSKKDTALYHCSSCHYQADRSNRLIRHVRWEHGIHGKTFTCPNCQRYFLSRNIMETHIVRVHGPNLNLKCSICWKSFMLEEELRRHSELHIDHNIFSCVICEYDATDSSSLIRHVQLEHDLKKYCCNFQNCRLENVAFSAPTDMRNHLSEKHQCEGNDLNLLNHCCKCERRFHQHSTLEAHQQKMHEGAGHLCPICGKLFFSDSSLTHHVREFHTALQMNPKCRICGKSIENDEALEQHERLHSDETPFDCVLCGVRHRTTFELKKHVVSNHESLPWKCPKEGCGRMYETKGKLQNHRTIKHGPTSDLKRHTCPNCPYTAKTPSILKKHILSHTKVPTVKCHFEGCGRAFVQRSVLVSHIRLDHNPSGPTPFHCKLCGKSFRTSGALNEHESHHGDARPFSCDLCPATFKTGNNLRTHNKVHLKQTGVRLQWRPRKARLGIILETSNITTNEGQAPPQEDAEHMD